MGFLHSKSKVARLYRLQNSWEFFFFLSSPDKEEKIHRHGLFLSTKAKELNIKKYGIQIRVGEAKPEKCIEQRKKDVVLQSVGEREREDPPLTNLVPSTAKYRI